MDKLILITLAAVISLGMIGGEELVTDVEFTGIEEPLITAEPTDVTVEKSDLLGLWQIVEYKGNEAIANGEFIEFSEWDTVTLYQYGDRIKLKDNSYAIEGNRLKVFTYNYSVVMDGLRLVMTPIDADAPAMVLQPSTEEYMTELAISLLFPQPGHQVEIYPSDDAIKSIITNKEWTQIGYLKADNEYMKTITGGTVTVFKFFEDTYSQKNILAGSLNGSWTGTYTLKDSTIILKSSNGYTHEYYVSILEDKTMNKTFLYLTYSGHKEAQVYVVKDN